MPQPPGKFSVPNGAFSVRAPRFLHLLSSPYLLSLLDIPSVIGQVGSLGGSLCGVRWDQVTTERKGKTRQAEVALGSRLLGAAEGFALLLAVVRRRKGG